MTRKVVDARQDDKGNITQVKIQGNQNFTPVATAIDMAKRGELTNAHAVTKGDGSESCGRIPMERPATT